MPKMPYSERSMERIRRLQDKQFGLVWDQEWDTIAEVVSWFAIAQDEVRAKRNDWRVLIVTPSMRRSTRLFRMIASSVPLPSNADIGSYGIRTTNGSIRVLDCEPHRLQGIMADSLLWVVLGWHSLDVWDCILSSIVDGDPNLMILASDPPKEYFHKFREIETERKE